MGFGIQILKHVRIGLVACLAIGGLPATAIAACSETLVELRGDWGDTWFTVEIADDPVEQAEGLMHRSEMAIRAGMIFMYPSERPVGFWMKNTLIPLDMLFIDKTGIVKRIHENAIPHDITSIGSVDPVLAVLEINGGLARALGITVGSELRNPLFQQNIAVWPCDG